MRLFDDGLDLVLDVGDEDRVIGGKISARFLDYCRMRNVFVVADGLDHVYDVVGEFAGVVICRRFERGPRTVVIDGHAAADVEILDRHAHLPDLGIGPGGLLHRVLDPFDIGELRTDVEMEQPQHVDPACLLEPADDLQDLGRRQAEFCGLAAGLFPFARAFRVKFYANADHRQLGFGIFCGTFVGDDRAYVQARSVSR